MIAAINADLIIAQELNDAAGRDSFLTNVLNVAQPGEWAATSWITLSFDEGGAVFYKPAKLTVTGLSALANSGPRDVMQCLVKPVGYTAAAAGSRVYSIHFKAGGPATAADAGAAANSHAIGMSTTTVGVNGGTLTVNSDDLDLPVSTVTLSGTVLDHAASSLDSSAALLTTPVDFGDHAVGEFSNQPVRVHNLGWDALQAQLAVSSANIVGGDGRFSIVGGFTPTNLAGVGQTWSLAFDDVGATLDQEYTATLTFGCADEALPGAAAANDLVVTLRAKPLSTPTGVPGQDLPKALAFHVPRPNPLSREALFAFDLPEAAPVSLAIYDLTGRRIASIVSGSLGAGRVAADRTAVATPSTGGRYSQARRDRASALPLSPSGRRSCWRPF